MGRRDRQLKSNELNSIISRITDQVARDSSWVVRVNDLEDYLNPVQLYRAVYQTRLIDRDVFGPETTGELVTLLEAAGFPDSEERFREAGLFLNHEDRVLLTERFVRLLHTAIVVHVPEPTIFRSMVQQIRRYDLAEATYCETYLPTEPIIRDCARDETTTRRRSPAFEVTARWYLTSLIERRIVALPGLGPALFDLLRTIGRQEGVLPPLSDDGGEQTVDPKDARETSARTVLNLPAGRISRRDIQTRYRKLMRRYHPDINPDGLEMAKRINAAYAELITSAGET